MVNASVCLATIEYHQQAVDLFSPFNHEWCTYYLNSGDVIETTPYSQVITAAKRELDSISSPIKQSREYQRLALERKEWEKQKRIAQQIAQQKIDQKRKAFQARVQSFRANLAEGDSSHCGLVVEVKEKIVRIESIEGLKYIKINQLYPKGSAPCEFYNGVYHSPFG
ncbi:hypothetical protein [Pseudoalteromonas sp. GB43]